MWQLLEQALDPATKIKLQTTALHYAAGAGLSKQVEVFLKEGVNATMEENGTTALQKAAEGGHVDVVQMLLENNKTTERDWNSVLYSAAKAGQKTVLCLHYATYAGHEEVARLLLSSAASVLIKDPGGYTPLVEAIRGGFGEDLLEKPVNVYFLKTHDPLGRQRTVQLLLRNRADVNEKTQYGTTGLLLATASRLKDLAKTLLENGADSNIRSVMTGTTLHEAAETGEVEIVRFLLEHGADPNATAGDGETVSALATGSERKEILRLLKQYTKRSS